MQENNRPMHSAMADIDELNQMTARLEESQRRRFGKKKEYARQDIARDVGITRCQIEGFFSRRTKTVPAWLKDRVRAELIAAIQQEAGALAHEIQLYRQTGAHPTSHALCEAEAHLLAARSLLEGK